MIKRVCDKYKKEEVLDNKELTERLRRYIRPSDKKTIIRKFLDVSTIRIC